MTQQLLLPHYCRDRPRCYCCCGRRRSFHRKRSRGRWTRCPRLILVRAQWRRRHLSPSTGITPKRSCSSAKQWRKRCTMWREDHLEIWKERPYAGKVRRESTVITQLARPSRTERASKATDAVECAGRKGFCWLSIKEKWIVKIFINKVNFVISETVVNQVYIFKLEKISSEHLKWASCQIRA